MLPKEITHSYNSSMSSQLQADLMVQIWNGHGDKNEMEI